MTFDPYFKWLGIPPEDQPPNHYRLLGLPPLVDDPDVIEHAADQRLAHLRNLGAGKHAALSQPMLNEITAAKLTLLDPGKKAAYDGQLRAALAAKRQQPTGEAPDEAAAGQPELRTRMVPRAEPLPARRPADPRTPTGEPRSRQAPIPIATSEPALSTRVRRSKSNADWQRPAALAAVALLAIAVVVAWGLTRNGSPPLPSGERAAAKPREERPPQPESSPPLDSSESASDVPKSSTNPPPPPDSLPPAEAKPAPEVKRVDPSDVQTTATTVPESKQSFEVSKPPPVASDKPAVEPAERKAASEKLPSITDATLPTPTTMAEQRIPVPGPDQLAEARRRLREAFGQVYEAAEDPQTITEAADQMLAEAGQLQDNPEARYALLQDARELAVTSGNVQLAVAATERLIEVFELDTVRLQVETLTELARQVRADRQRHALAVAGDALLDDLVAADRYKPAERIGRLATAAARRVGDWTLVKRLVARGRQLEQIEAAHQDAERAKESGQDVDLVVGRFLSFFKGDWEGGLVRLARGNDEQLSALARQELAKPTAVSEQIALADAWWDLAERQEGLVQAHLRQHAGAWFQRAMLNATGLGKKRVEQRLARLAAADPPLFGGGDIHKAVQRAVSRGAIVETSYTGAVDVGTVFRELPPEGRLLVGVRVTTGRFGGGMAHKALASIQPIYADPDGQQQGKTYGPALGNPLEFVAEQGYAVGAIRLKMQPHPRVLGLQVIFMRISGDRLDPEDRYASEPYIDIVEDAAVVGGDGRPIVGIKGCVSKQEMRGLGVIQTR